MLAPGSQAREKRYAKAMMSSVIVANQRPWYQEKTLTIIKCILSLLARTQVQRQALQRHRATTKMTEATGHESKNTIHRAA